MVKVYTSMQFQLSVLINIDGKSKRITFSGGGIHQSGVFTTNNEVVQGALEAHPNFGKKFYLLKYYSDKTEESVPENTQQSKYFRNETLKEYDSKRVQDASYVLQMEYGVPRKEVDTKAKILVKAQELNISFPNLA